jgi:hypothetical protein
VYGNSTKKSAEHMKSLKMAVFWDEAPCSLVDIDWRFRGAYCLRRLFINVAVREKLKSHLWRPCLWEIRE